MTGCAAADSVGGAGAACVVIGRVMTGGTVVVVVELGCVMTGGTVVVVVELGCVMTGGTVVVVVVVVVVGVWQFAGRTVCPSAVP